MKILMVGAGAVGAVYGRHLQLGGADVAFLVKPKYVDELRAGLTLYPLNRPCAQRTVPVHWSAYEVLPLGGAFDGGGFDQVWLSVSSTALRGDWLGEVLRRCPNATVVSLQPGWSDRELLLQHVPEERLVNGGITLISYQAPLPGEERFPEPGIAYWLPPLAGSPFTGPEAAVATIVDTLGRGGMRAVSAPNFLHSFPYLVAAMSPMYAGLEAGGWRFRDVVRGDLLSRIAAASREAVAITAARQGERAPWIYRLVRGWMLRLVLIAAKRVVQLDLETYLEYHFTKVGDQTRLHLDELIADARRLGCDASQLERLRKEIGSRGKRHVA